jgi:glucosamine-6-phosphate deaminase
MADDLQAEATRYEALLDELQVDLQLLGIGSNAHIGFNEPGTSFTKLTHVTDLAKETLEANARFFDTIDAVPTQAITMGIASILKAKRIVLIATGASKAQAIRCMVQGPVSETCPASVLQNHPKVLVIVDKEAASAL